MPGPFNLSSFVTTGAAGGGAFPLTRYRGDQDCRECVSFQHYRDQTTAFVPSFHGCSKAATPQVNL